MQQERAWPGGDVPPFEQYFAPVHDASPEVQSFYRWLKDELDAGRTPDIDGQVSYLFAFIYGIIEQFGTFRNYELLATRFAPLRRGYGHTKVRSYLDRWQSDAAIVSGLWTEAVQLHQQADLSLLRHVSQQSSSPLLAGQTLYQFASPRVPLTPWGARRRKQVVAAAEAIATDRHALLGVNIIDEVFDQFPDVAHLTNEEVDVIVDDLDNGLDLTHLADNLRSAVAFTRDFGIPSQERRVNLFAGTAVYIGDITVPSIPTFYATIIEHRIRWLFREAENSLRREAGVPEVGDGWLSETELFNLVRNAFKDTRVTRHARPAWLTPQHLDVYLPRENVAIEFQGEQHYGPVEIFGGEAAFARQVERDNRKRAACAANGCRLIEVRAGYDPDDLLNAVRTAFVRT